MFRGSSEVTRLGEMAFLELLKEKIIVFDGAMGSGLHALRLESSMRRNIKLLICVAIMSLPVIAVAQPSKPPVLRKIFGAIPSEYFSIACCEGNADAFIKKYVTVDESAGYMEGADTEEDPQYSGFQMAVFRRTDGSYLVAFHSEAQRWSDFYFLDYRNGKIKNVSATIPQYSQKNFYEYSRKTKAIGVFQKKYDNPREPLGADNTVSKGRKLYNLIWENGKFVVRK